MALPIIKTPEFDLYLPYSKKNIKFRPFLVREEKILLMAMESTDESTIFEETKRVVEDCILTEGFDLNVIPTFEYEYIFMHLRSKSVGEIVELQVKHIDNKNVKGEECTHVQDISVNLEDVKLDVSEDLNPKIQINDEVGVVLRYPSVERSRKLLTKGSNDVERSFYGIVSCIEKIWDKDTVYDSSDYSDEELISFIEQFSKEQFMKVQEFFVNMPKLSHVVTYTCSGCGEEERVVLEGLQSFFG